MFATSDWVIVKQDVEKKTAGGIIIPDKVAEKRAPARGTVLYAGKECKEVKVDDFVLFSKEDAFTDTIGEETCVFVREKNVCMVSRDE